MANTGNKPVKTTGSLLASTSANSAGVASAAAIQCTRPAAMQAATGVARAGRAADETGVQVDAPVGCWAWVAEEVVVGGAAGPGVGVAKPATATCDGFAVWVLEITSTLRVERRSAPALKCDPKEKQFPPPKVTTTSPSFVTTKSWFISMQLAKRALLSP